MMETRYCAESREEWLGGAMPRWSTRSLVRYTLIQVPAVIILVVILYLLRRWIDLPAWFVWGFVVLWIVKDVILFPMVWRSYDSDPTGGAGSMVGEKGIALERLDPSGYIRLRGELWRAEVLTDVEPIEKGQTVNVCEVRGLTLLVQPEKELPSPN